MQLQHHYLKAIMENINIPQRGVRVKLAIFLAHILVPLMMIGMVSSFSTIRRSREFSFESSPHSGLSHKSSTFWNSVTSPLPMHSTTRGTSSDSDSDGTTATSGIVNIDEKIMQDILFRIRECNKIPDDVRAKLIDFVVDDTPIGKVTLEVATMLCNSSPSESETESETDPVFEITSDNNDNVNNNQTRQFLTLTESAGSTSESRTDAVMSVMTNLKSEGIIKGWRDELYAVSDGFYNEPLFFVERASAPFLGIMQYGVHINGIVKSNADIDADDERENMWIARRSPTKSTYPSMTDQIVAGGQGAGLGLMENVLKECQEEAGIPDELTKNGIKAIGAVSYEMAILHPHLDIHLLERMVLFNYDLILPDSFLPTVVDGEVEEFIQWDVQEQLASMAKDYHDPMKPNCYLCVIDYLLRKGHLSPDTKGYLDVLRELRSGSCI